ncbi:hypothetical protein BJ875DRAFT_372696 [Amylocarpus encephaloides]|uniref:Kelch repeat protein n=1 Tax=Amylocarpus encephaloides TaxID=45428 RepID=A0A9P7YMB3_9HELO|nr:hypothetical protein BJ875DRAFT_372696 [Amylocarpus encephaloides]
MIRSMSLLLAVAAFVRLVAAQAAGWQSGQVNSSMCYWESPRAAVIRDTVYIDGGYLWWTPGMADGTFSGPVNDGNPLGLVYLLNFSTPFNTTGGFNLTAAFTTISKAASGANANNIGPLYLDGAMLANDNEWITYGGLYKNTDAYKPQDANAVAAYQRYQYGPPRDQFQPGYVLQDLPTGMTRYVSNGAPVSVPSENLGFYFSGLRSASSGAIFDSPAASNSSFRANVTSATLISLDLSVQGKEVWNNDTLPTTVPGRANAEIVWVPVGTRGILVAIGGVINPSFATVSQSLRGIPGAQIQSQRTSPTFMSTVSVYDIASKTWYEQNTTNSTSGRPGQLTQGCTVLASAQDGSSHNIYWYGGYDGIDLAKEEAYSDDVWVLSIPSFTWVKVKSGTSSHSRAGHRCVKPYPDQMLVIGGHAPLVGTTPKCVDGGIVQIFNLNTATWTDQYTPTTWSNYTVPPSVIAVIGGTALGGSAQTAPSPGGFSNTSLATVFNTKYNTTKITNWYPYQLAAENGTTNRTNLLPSPVAKSGGGTPKYLAPVLGVVLGLVFISLLILAFVLWGKRKYFKANGGTGTQSEAGTMDNRRWVTNWLRATPAAASESNVKAPTVTTDETPITPAYEEELAYTVPEMAGVPVLEMEDTSRPTELHDTGFVPLTASSLNQRSSGLDHSTSRGSHISHNSSVSADSSPRPAISPAGTPRADSPPPGAAIGELPERPHLHSGVSGVSEGERGHLRGISETSVSTDGAYATPMGIPDSSVQGQVTSQQVMAPPTSEPNRLGGIVSPMTPTAGTGESGDYLGTGLAGNSGGSPSVKRKSQFSEKLDDDK